MSKRSERRVVGQKRLDEIRRLNKLVQNKKSYIRRQKGLEVEGVETVKPETFNDGSHSVSDYNKYVKELRSFLHGDKKTNFNVKNKQNAILPYSDILEVEKDVKAINRKRKKAFNEIKDLEFKHRGETIGDVKDLRLLQGSRFSQFQPVTFNVHSIRNLKELAEKKSQMEWRKNDMNSESNKRLQESYLKGLINNFNYLSPEVMELYLHLQQMNNGDFMKLYWTNNLTEIGFQYTPLDAQVKLDEMRRAYGIGEK